MGKDECGRWRWGRMSVGGEVEVGKDECGR